MLSWHVVYLKRFEKVFTLFLLCLISACVTRPTVNMGIQPGYQSLNPGRILALPVVVEPDPGRRAVVDTAAVESGAVIPLVEAAILRGFRDQPGVAGTSFQTVKKALDAMEPNPWNKLVVELRSRASAFWSDDPKIREKISDLCQKQQNFLEFYNFCLLDSGPWREGLNEISGKIANADAALITVITGLDRKVVDDAYTITIEIASLLIDTNSGKIIWCRQTRDTIDNGLDKPTFPEWVTILSRLFSEPFWLDFPGRVQKI